MSIAVIGAGMAGAACAAALHAAGHEVRLVDKGRSVGGRMAQRRRDGFVFDHGAQYFKARDPGFRALAETWAEDGIATPWPDGEAFIGVPSMNAPVKALLGDLPVEREVQVDGLRRAGTHWRLVAGDRELGPFQAVVIAIPPTQAVELLRAADDRALASMILELGSVRVAPCWSLMLGFEQPLASDEPAQRLDGEPVAWVARHREKPGRGEAEAWIVHAGPDWSRAHLELTADDVAARLLQAARPSLPADMPEPAYAQAHRWRYALVERPLGRDFMLDEPRLLGLCGDWCIAPRVEAAWQSGTRLGATLNEALERFP